MGPECETEYDNRRPHFLVGAKDRSRVNRPECTGGGFGVDRDGLANSTATVNAVAPKPRSNRRPVRSRPETDVLLIAWRIIRLRFSDLNFCTCELFWVRPDAWYRMRSPSGFLPPLLYTRWCTKAW